MTDVTNESQLPEASEPKPGQGSNQAANEQVHKSHMPTVSRAGPEHDADQAETLPQIEGFKITGKISDRGGQGTVWRAVQLSTSREVALKVLKAGVFSSRQVRTRFEREVELAASLEHPNIARVYDSGLHYGVHYYAMELIDGVHLDEYVEENALTQRQILGLMCTVCQAVQYAHQRGIIHRDLKPSNIMVTPDGQPHVVDFGLAKTFIHALGDVTVSVEGAAPGTPVYMSPEQAAGRVSQLDTRTDVYSLGVILFRLLIKEFPHDPSGRSYEVTRRIAEEEVRRPREVTAEVDKELEALLLKALAHDPDTRYASSGELATDIDNYLTGEPLTARKPTTVYFLRKRLRKYRFPVAIACAVLALLIGTAVFTYVRVSQERSLAEFAARKERTARLKLQARQEQLVAAKKAVETARDEAQNEANRAKAVTGFLRRMLAGANPSFTRGRRLTVREMLDWASKRINREFVGQPLSRASLHHVIGVTYTSLGDYRTAEWHNTEALRIRHAHLGKEHPDTLSSRSSLAILLSHQGKYGEAEKLHREVLEIRRRILGKEHPDTLGSMHNFAVSLSQQGKYGEAKKLNREVLEIRRRILGKEHPETLGSMNELAILLSKQGKYAEAEKLHREVLEVSRRVLGKAHPDTLGSIHNFAISLSQQGKDAEAEELRRETVEVSQRVLGKDHPDTLGAMHNLAISLSHQGKYGEAEKLLWEVLEISRWILGKEHPNTLGLMSNLAISLGKQGKYAEAEKLYREVLKVRRRVLGKDHPDTLSSMSNLAISLGKQGKYAEAEKLLREVVEVSRQALGREHSDTLGSMSNLALSLGKQGEHAEAESLFRKVLGVRRRVLGKEHPKTLSSMSNLAISLGKQSKDAEAEKLYREVLKVKRRVLGKEHPFTLGLMNNLAASLYYQQKYVEAETLCRSVLPGMVKVLGTQHPLTRRTIRLFVSVLRAQGKHDEAARLLTRHRLLRHLKQEREKVATQPSVSK